MTSADYFRELQKKIANHPGNAVLEALRGYDISMFILDGNICQLRQLIQTLEDPKDPAKIAGIEQRGHLQWFFNDLIRQLHNFLTSITTLIDHSRHLMGKSFVKREHFEEYKIKIKVDFANDPLTQFLKDLRNYVTHYAIPQITLQEELATSNPIDEPLKLFLDMDHFATGFNWSSPSRCFLAANKPRIRLLKFVNEYEIKAHAFCNGLMFTFQKHLGRELHEVQTLMRESNSLIGYIER